LTIRDVAESGPRQQAKEVIPWGTISLFVNPVVEKKVSGI